MKLDEVTGGKAEVEESVKDCITEKWLICCRHVRRIGEHSLPRQSLEWRATENWRRGRPRQIWNEAIRELVREGRSVV